MMFIQGETVFLHSEFLPDGYFEVFLLYSSEILVFQVTFTTVSLELFSSKQEKNNNKEFSKQDL